MTTLQKFSLENPILVGMILLSIALFFRILDIFVIRSDERLGEIIFSKSLGFILILFFIWGTGQGLKSMGLHSFMFIQTLFIGVLITAIALFAGYLVEYLIAVQRGVHPELYFSAIDPKANVSGGLLFGVWLLFGNIINSFMEEGLFRGVLIRLFGRELSFEKANWLQSILFGAWHLPWVIKAYRTGHLVGSGALLFSTVSNFVPQLFVGLVWGYMYLKTNSLWTSWIAHTLTNSTLNLLHIRTDEGLDGGIAIRMTVYMIVMLLSWWLIKHLANWFGTPAVKPWGEIS